MSSCTYYAQNYTGIIPYAILYLLCSKLCWHNSLHHLYLLSSKLCRHNSLCHPAPIMLKYMLACLHDPSTHTHTRTLQIKYNMLHTIGTDICLASITDNITHCCFCSPSCYNLCWYFHCCIVTRIASLVSYNLLCVQKFLVLCDSLHILSWPLEVLGKDNRGEQGKDWDEHLKLDAVLFDMTSIQQTTKCIPFFLMHGREAQLPIKLAIVGLTLMQTSSQFPNISSTTGW